MISYKGRTIDPDVPVCVYRNLHKNMFSVKQNGRIVAHTDRLCLKDCRMHVSDAGRERTIMSRRKQVHAWIAGIIDNHPMPQKVAEITRKVEIAFENTVSSYSKRECPSVLYRVVFEATTDHMKKTLVVRYYDDEALMRLAIENTSLERVVSAAVLVLESELNV